MLTGTPLQNDLEELQNLLSFLLPDVFNADVAAQLADEQAWTVEPCKMYQVQNSVYFLQAEQWKAPYHDFPASQGMLSLVAHGILMLVADFAAVRNDVVPRAPTA